MIQIHTIEKSILLAAPRSRVWRAITDAEELGTWFRVKLQSAFVAGEAVLGQHTFPGYADVNFEIVVERIEPESLFSLRWHPYAVDQEIDHDQEPTTLVEFRLADVPGGTRVTITESGFEHLPADRREDAFRLNANGWEQQLENIKRHVGG